MKCTAVGGEVEVGVAADLVAVLLKVGLLKVGLLKVGLLKVGPPKAGLLWVVRRALPKLIQKRVAALGSSHWRA